MQKDERMRIRAMAALSEDLGGLADDVENPEMQDLLDQVNRDMVALGLPPMVEDLETYLEGRAVETLTPDQLRDEILSMQNRLDSATLAAQFEGEVADVLKEYVEGSEDAGTPVSMRDFAEYLMALTGGLAEEGEEDPRPAVKVTVDEYRALQILELARGTAADLAGTGTTDDRWDYEQAAARIAGRLERALASPGGYGALVSEVEALLNEPVEEWLACDGDIRFGLPELAEKVRAWENGEDEALATAIRKENDERQYLSDEELDAMYEEGR